MMCEAVVTIFSISFQGNGDSGHLVVHDYSITEKGHLAGLLTSHLAAMMGQ